MTAAPEMCPESAACPRSELAKSCADIWGARAAALELGRRFSVPGVWLIISFIVCVDSTHAGKAASSTCHMIWGHA